MWEKVRILGFFFAGLQNFLERNYLEAEKK